jgi:catechol 2,3-dioxygenase-like lactoylglutathione lyase family enzyme
MSRVQLALNVSDLESSVQFYSTMFATQPHKRRAGYANFEIDAPPLKLVLIETTHDVRGSGVTGALNHLGVEVESADDVHAALGRLQDAGLAVSEELDTTCCYAQQDKVWVHDPAGAPWEVYTITDDNPVAALDMDFVGKMNDGASCIPASSVHPVPSAGKPDAASTCC